MSERRTHHVTFHPPALASQHLPVPITGQGSLTYSPDGLEVQGAKVASLGRNGVVVLGFFGGFVAIIAIGLIFGLQDHIEKLVAAGMALGVILYGAFNRRPVKEGEPVTHRYTWAQIAKVQWDGASKSLMIVTKKAKPKGGIYMPMAQGSSLELELTEAWRTYHKR